MKQALLLAALGVSLLLAPPRGLALEAPADATGIVAVVNGKVIVATALDEPPDEEVRELEREIVELQKTAIDKPGRRRQIYEREQRIFELKRKRLDEVIGEQLLAEEAATRGIGREELLAKEADATVPAVTDEQVDTFYERHKSKLVNRPEAELKQKARRILEKYRRLNAREKYLESLRARAAISTFLPAPVLRFDVSVAGAPFKGPETAAVTIVKFEDFDCSFCRSAQTTIDQLLARYGDRVKLVHRDFPLDPQHAKSLAHQAARCAGDQGRFWAYHDALYASTRKSTPDELKVHAEAIGLDVDAFAQCLAGGTGPALVQRDVDEGRRVGVKATPTFFVNGRPLVGAQPLERFVEIVDQELKSVR